MIGLLARTRRSLYASGILRAKTLPRPVVSVGNLVVGGAGKTPHVIFIASWLMERGLKVAVLSRGYGRRSAGVVWVSRGDAPLVTAEQGGDEPVLMAGSLRGVSVIVGESRVAAGEECLRSTEVDVFLLDDGFQHLALRRDADLLLVDAGRGLSNLRTLPLGPLREGPEAARFADALVVTGCADLPHGERVAMAVPVPPDRPRAYSRLVARAVVDRKGEVSPLPPTAENREVAAFCGLAVNERFETTLRESGYAVRAFLPFPDHHRYGGRDIERIASAAAGLPVMTTEKDLVRLPGSLPFDVRAIRVGVEFLEGWEDLSSLLLGKIARPEAS